MKLTIPAGSKVWFSSDFHYDHDRDFIWGWRGFPNIKEYNQFLLDDMNKHVGQDDWFFHIGDLIFKGNNKKFLDFLESLNVKKIHCVEGNHDSQMIQLAKHHKKIENHGPYLELKLKGEDGENHRVTLCHYAMETWNLSHYGSVSLCGHHHGTRPHLHPSTPNLRRLEVSVDNNLDFLGRVVISWDEVWDCVKNLPYEIRYGEDKP